MIRHLRRVAAIAAAALLPVAAQAQGGPGGVERGARDGERVGGPVGGTVGAIVGGVVGGVGGGVTGILGREEIPRFRTYAVEQRRPSYQYREDVRIGVILPEEGVTYYDVPPVRCRVSYRSAPTARSAARQSSRSWSDVRQGRLSGGLVVCEGF